MRKSSVSFAYVSWKLLADVFRDYPGTVAGCLYLWVEENINQFRQSTQNAGLCPTEFHGQFSGDSAFNFHGNLCVVSLVSSGNGHVS